ncbi:hypothetical protein SGQ44_14720 [Flavobacterium sp. Fl-77]|uniref:Uncharacterized protein n=1 Tax=Flavobacterium flavipigmentatum TaxID=2893884 RepID=A0AAJ2W266_9FLAO|nr:MULTISPECIES: hypothetical protein [unclassified Flavobacterium]MDX6183583.1 hypothetical protein [Flavobacterium sp. Fl-33]MDX6187015.1 hypothetical protein [Flavobacterium sp. Fl-77]UFH40253.1 hypothetical protein LNP22_08230 [Flavobacterium sp. F-70]
MNKSIFLIIYFFSLTIMKAQERDKDTLFFNIDKYYTISPTITSNLTNKTYLEIVEFQKQLMTNTKTNGYVYFIGDGILTKGLKPKKVLSIKDYVENRKFYLDGKYNKIIDDGKLKDSLTDKYKIFFINGDEFISPRVLEYYSYYPIREGDKVIQNKIKDTLFFKLDNDYVYESKYAPKVYLVNENIESSEVFSLRELEIIKSLKSKKILSLRDYVKSSRFYNENRTTKLNKIYFMKYLQDYVIFLVNNKNEYIKVEPSVVIED